MKINIIIIAIILLSNPWLFAQKEINVEAISRTMSKGTQPGLMVLIHDAELQEVNKSWQKLIREGSKNKVEEVDDEIVLIEAQNAILGSKPLNIYSIVSETVDGIKVIAFYELEGEFFSSESDEDKYHRLVKYLKEFAILEYEKVIADDLKEEGKQLKALGNEFEKLIKEHEQFHKDIGKLERDIIQYEQDIEDNLLDQERKRNEIGSQKDEIAKLKDNPDAKKEAEKELKALMGEKKKLENANDSYHKKIHKTESEIRENERSIVQNELEQDISKEKIREQQERVKDVEDMLENIK